MIVDGSLVTVDSGGLQVNDLETLKGLRAVSFSNPQGDAALNACVTEHES